ncbi:MAK16 [Fusarium circinatum]|uniref:MAK16 n=1 Tax=Fusarium circinatum TaxID=48490 RepID=A0A8H5U7H0_FUSCI|nr:MAK16 [Fusarium circinatum]
MMLFQLVNQVRIRFQAHHDLGADVSHSEVLSSVLKWASEMERSSHPESIAAFRLVVDLDKTQHHHQTITNTRTSYSVLTMSFSGNSDEILWQIIGQQFCAFKIKTNKAQTFCRNEHNVTGLCNRQSCPLANSRYATVREHQNRLYLMIKTPERAHLPSKLWQRYKLPSNYSKALSMIDEKLIYWPNFLIHKCKQRLTRLTQVQTRMRRIAAEEERLGEKLVPKMAPKIRHREQARERKAEAAAKLERTIERELVERLRQGAYGDQPLNVSESIWKKVLNAMERDGEGQRDKDMDKGLDENGEEVEWSEEEDDNLEQQVEYVSDIEESDEELGDLEDWLESENEEEDEDEDDDDDSEESETEKSGNKRKRGRAIKMKNKKPRQEEKEKLMLTNDLTW